MYTRKNKVKINNWATRFAPSPHEVKAVMHLLLRLQLFGNETVENDTTDSLMREIALNRGKISGNTLRTDKEFAMHFVDFYV